MEEIEENVSNCNTEFNRPRPSSQKTEVPSQIGFFFFYFLFSAAKELFLTFWIGLDWIGFQSLDT